MADHAGALHLSPDQALPLDVVTDTIAILARRGAGKTYAAGKLVECMLDAGVQVVIVDPVGTWRGLRLLADGHSPGYEIPILGGLHGDLPLGPEMGARLAALLVERRLSAVLDVSMLRKGQRQTFITAFGEELLHQKKSSRSPLHLVLEEAQVYVPQRAVRGQERLLGAMEDLIKLGRNFGIGATLISQRPQAIHKDCLNQAGLLILLQMVGPQERKAIADWMADQELNTDVPAELSHLQPGTAIVWSPGRKIYARVAIGRKATFDASATPTVGQPQDLARPLAALDLEDLRQALAGDAAAPEDDAPAALRRRIAVLEEALRRAAAAPAAAVGVRLSPEQAQELERLSLAVTEANKNAIRAVEQVGAVTTLLLHAQRRLAPAASAPAPRPAAPARSSPPSGPPPAPAPAPQRAASAPTGKKGLVRGARNMLWALASLYPRFASRAQLASLARLAQSGGSFSTYLSRLRRAALIEEPFAGIRITPAGLERLGAQRPAPALTSEALVALWLCVLRGQARKMLRTLVQVYPQGMSRGDLARLCELAANGGTFGTYLSRLRRNSLIVERAGVISAHPALFEVPSPATTKGAAAGGPHG